ncbi:hypothetical protein H4R21_002704 [Coemansia helicoidea]|uniref:Uncharacterized protein n=2 Tax=Coemansia TaxID=4863 RepID=A0ACC1L5J2_9FUNG|nr:hypothetical protein H4R21_002704 [Coemansia helicoidea]
MRPPPSEQELWLRESREMLHAQATQLHQLQEIVRELVSQSGQRTNPALAINGSLSALMSEGSSPLQQPTPQFAHHNGYVFGGAPPPHYQQRAAPQPGQNYGYPVPTSAPVDIQLSRYGPRHRAADEPSPRTPLPPITPGRRESEHSAEEPRTGMDAELDKVKSHVMYLMKRVDMPRILLEQLTPTEEEGSTGRGRAFTALVADLKRLGALSRNNVKDYLEVFVRSLETAERD